MVPAALCYRGSTMIICMHVDIYLKKINVRPPPISITSSGALHQQRMDGWMANIYLHLTCLHPACMFRRMRGCEGVGRTGMIIMVSLSCVNLISIIRTRNAWQETRCSWTNLCLLCVTSFVTVKERELMFLSEVCVLHVVILIIPPPSSSPSPRQWAVLNFDINGICVQNLQHLMTFSAEFVMGCASQA